MKIRNLRHKGLRRLFEEDKTSGLPAPSVDKIRKMLAFLQDMDSVEELQAIPAWRAHRLTGNRRGVWSLTVSRNRRLTFRIDATEGEILDLDFEDYH